MQEVAVSQDIVVGDFNKDSATDFACGTVYTGVKVYLNKNDKSGAFSGPYTYLSGSRVPLAVPTSRSRPS